MRLVANELVERGVPEHNVIFMNLDRREFRKVTDADSFDAAIEARCNVPGIEYLFIDEVQNVEGFESVLCIRCCLCID